MHVNAGRRREDTTTAASAVSEALGDALGGVAARAARSQRARPAPPGAVGSHPRQRQQATAPSLLGPQSRLPISIAVPSGAGRATARVEQRSVVAALDVSASMLQTATTGVRPATGASAAGMHHSRVSDARLAVVTIDIPPLLDRAQHDVNVSDSSVSSVMPSSLSPPPFQGIHPAGFRRRTSIHKSSSTVEANALSAAAAAAGQKPPHLRSTDTTLEQSATSSARQARASVAAAAAPTNAASSKTTSVVHMASAFLRRKQPFLASESTDNKPSTDRHAHALPSATSEAAASRMFFHVDPASECESQVSQSHASVSSVSLPESTDSSSTNVSDRAVDKRELRPAKRKDSTSTRLHRKASTVQGGPSRIGELSREEDEFDFAILLKPSKYEELLELPPSDANDPPFTSELHDPHANAVTRADLSASSTTTVSAAATTSMPSTCSITDPVSIAAGVHAHLHAAAATAAKHDPARARHLIIARIQQTGLHVKRLLSLDGKQTLLKVKAPAAVLELGAERLRLRKLRRFDRIWIEFATELRATFADYDVSTNTVQFIDSEKQSIVHALLTSDDGGAGLNEFSALKTKYVVHMFPLHKQDLGDLKRHWVTYWRAPHRGTSTLSHDNAIRPSSRLRDACCSRVVCDVLTQPIDDVAQYFGEKVAFYFAWMEMYTRWLVVPSAVGLILFGLQVATKTIDHPLAPLYAIFMALWTTAFLVAWRRRAAALAYRWGTLGYEEDVEATRPEFYGDPALSTPAHKRYPAWRRWLKYGVTLPTVLASMVLTLGLTFAAFSTRDRLEAASLAAKTRAKTVARDIAADLEHGLTLANLKRLTKLGLDWRFWFYFLVTPMLYGLFIPVLDYGFTVYARAMTNWENHRTESRHRSHLILKVFSFRFVHVFASLYYYAFADVPAVTATTTTDVTTNSTDSTDDAHAPALPSDNLLRVAIQLASFMVAGQLWKNVMETLVPFVRRRYRVQQKKRDTNLQFSQSAVFRATAAGGSGGGPSTTGMSGTRRRGHDAAALAARGRATPGSAIGNTNALIHEQCVRLEQASDKAWEEAELEPYDTFEDYTEMLIQFGYVSFFSLAFPLAPLLALLNNVFELRTDAFKLCHTKQRPIAHKASGIGIWFLVLQFMSALAVLTNCLHVAFTTSLLERLVPDAAATATATTKVWLAFGAEHALLALQVAVMVAVPAMPRDVQDNVRVERERAKQESARAMAARLLELGAATDDVDCHDVRAAAHLHDDEQLQPVSS